MTAQAPEPLDVAALRRLTPEQLASDFHHNYETLAPHFGYRTRPETAVPWEQVPERNKALMVAVIRSLVFEDLNLPAILAALSELEGLRSENEELHVQVVAKAFEVEQMHAAANSARAALEDGRSDVALSMLRSALAAREAEEVSGD
jgi:hypothetical protein